MNRQINTTVNPELWGKVRTMLVADPPPTLEITRTWKGEAAVRIVSAPKGRGIPREKFLVVAESLAELFWVLSEAVTPREEG